MEQNSAEKLNFDRKGLENYLKEGMEIGILENADSSLNELIYKHTIKSSGSTIILTRQELQETLERADNQRMKNSFLTTDNQAIKDGAKLISERKFREATQQQKTEHKELSFDSDGLENYLKESLSVLGVDLAAQEQIIDRHTLDPTQFQDPREYIKLKPSELKQLVQTAETTRRELERAGEKDIQSNISSAARSTREHAFKPAQKAQLRPDPEVAYSVDIENNRVMIKFSVQPPPDTRKELLDKKFRYEPHGKYWETDFTVDTAKTVERISWKFQRKEQEIPETQRSEISVKVNDKKNGVIVSFTTQPPEATLKDLKDNEFKYAPVGKYWYKENTPENQKTALALQSRAEMDIAISSVEKRTQYLQDIKKLQTGLSHVDRLQLRKSNEKLGQSINNSMGVIEKRLASVSKGFEKGVTEAFQKRIQNQHAIIKKLGQSKGFGLES